MKDMEDKGEAGGKSLFGATKSELSSMKKESEENLSLNKEIEEHQARVKSILDSIQDRSSVDKKESELDKYRSQIKKNLKKLNKDKKFFENNDKKNYLIFCRFYFQIYP